MPTSPDIYHVVLFSYDRGHTLSDGTKSLPGHVFVGFYKNYLSLALKGHSPRKGYFTQKKLWKVEIPVPNLGRSGDHNESHHSNDHQHMAAFEVSAEKFDAAFAVRQSFYIIGLNDCVTYVSAVCQKAGLHTPDWSDGILMPTVYFNHIKSHNTVDSAFIPGRRR